MGEFIAHLQKCHKALTQTDNSIYYNGDVL